MGEQHTSTLTTEGSPLFAKITKPGGNGVEESLSTCSTHSHPYNDVKEDLHTVVQSALSELIERIVLEQAPEEYNESFAPLANCLSSYDSRTNRVLTKIMCNFEHYVNESYLGVQRREATPSGYSGMDAFVAKDMIESTIRQLYPYCQVEAYGSLSTGLWLPGQSDIDLLLDFNKLNISEGSMLKYFPAISPPPFQIYRSSSHRNMGLYSTPKHSNTPQPIEVEQPTHVNPIIQNAYIHSWTQMMNHLYLQNNDLHQRRYTRKELIVILEEAEEAFRKTSWFRDIKLIKSSMPVIKFKVCCGEHGIYQIPVDVSVLTADHAGLPARDYICQVINKCPGVFRPLVLVLKQLLRENGLHDVYTGGLGSYTLCLLVVFFLIRCGFNLSHLRAKSEYSTKRGSPPAMFHLPPNPLPNQFSTATSEILLDDKGVPPLLDCSFEDKYKQYPPSLKQQLISSSEKILKTTGQIRAHIFNTDSVRRIPELLGCLLMGFLRLFCLKEHGGIDLSIVGFRLGNKGKLFLSDKAHSGVLIECPVTGSNSVGLGSYNILEIQSLFSRVRASLATEPQKLLFHLKYNQRGYGKHNFAINQNPPPLPPPIEPPRLATSEIESKKKLESSFVEKTKKKKFTFDLKEMNRQLAAVQEARYKRKLRESNLAKFHSETFERKQVLANRYPSLLQLSKDKVTKRQQAVLGRDTTPLAGGERRKRAPLRTEPSFDLQFSQPKPTYIELKRGSGSRSPKNALQSQVDFWEQNNLKKGNTSPNRTIPASNLIASKKIQTSWATIVKSPTADAQPPSPQSIQPIKTNRQLHQAPIQPQIPPPIDRSPNTFSTGLSYIPNNSAMLKATFATRNKRRTNFRKGVQARKFKIKEDKLDQRASPVLFIGNLSYYANVSDIESLKLEFASFGQVLETSYDKKQGMLWIKFAEVRSSVIALKHMDQKMFLNRPLYVDFSQMPPEGYTNLQKSY